MARDLWAFVGVARGGLVRWKRQSMLSIISCYLGRATIERDGSYCIAYLLFLLNKWPVAIMCNGAQNRWVFA